MSKENNRMWTGVLVIVLVIAISTLFIYSVVPKKYCTDTTYIKEIILDKDNLMESIDKEIVQNIVQRICSKDVETFGYPDVPTALTFSHKCMDDLFGNSCKDAKGYCLIEILNKTCEIR